MNSRPHRVAAPVLCALLAVGPAVLSQGRAAAQAPAARPAAPAAATTDLTPALSRLLEEIRDKDTGRLAISAEDGRFLRALVAASGARRVLEIGGASGYSAIWIALGLRETGGRLVTIEYDPARAKALQANIARAGMADIVEVRAGDAFAEIPKLSGTLDFVFLDAWKKDYKRFLDLVLPRLDRGGVFVAHNVVNKRSEMGEFLDAIERNPALLTSIVSPSGEGVSVSYKRR